MAQRFCSYPVCSCSSLSREELFLFQRAVNFTVAAALNGWGPDDLFHVLGPSAHSVLYRAASRIPSQLTNTTLRKAWLLLGPPHCDAPKPDLNSLVIELRSLGVLKDAEILNASPASDPKDPQSKIRARIDALLRKAESTEFEDEADALIAKAQMLRQQHRISEVLHAPVEGRENITARRVYLHAPYIKHQLTLLGVVARCNGGTCLLLDDRGIAVVFGTPTDVSHICDLFDSLNRQCAWHMDRGEHFEDARARRQTSSYRRSFRLSYAARIGELLREANADSATAAATKGNEAPFCSSPEYEVSHYDVTSKALPILSRRRSVAEQSRDRLFPHLSTMSLSITHFEGMEDGIDAAQRSNLGGDSRGLHGTQQIAS